MKHLLSSLFILIGIFCLIVGGYYLWLRTDNKRLTFHTYPYAREQTVGELLPQRIRVPAIAIDVPVFPAEVTNNSWETTNDGASYLLSSPIPGDTGNSIIYAHNWASLFGNLPKIKTGEKVLIEFADGSQKTFTVQATAFVTPNDARILAPSKDKRITIYTCDGWFDAKRFVAVAVLDK